VARARGRGGVVKTAVALAPQKIQFAQRQYDGDRVAEGARLTNQTDSPAAFPLALQGSRIVISRFRTPRTTLEALVRSYSRIFSLVLPLQKTQHVKKRHGTQWKKG
jgi:hypothetical protein